MSAWNLEKALKRLGNDESLLVDLIGFFQEDSPKLREEIAAALDSGDAREIQRNAHALKGLCANFEATAAVTAAAEIENLGAERVLDATQYDLATLDEKITELSQALALWQTQRELS